MSIALSSCTQPTPAQSLQRPVLYAIHPGLVSAIVINRLSTFLYLLWFILWLLHTDSMALSEHSMPFPKQSESKVALSKNDYVCGVPRDDCMQTVCLLTHKNRKLSMGISITWRLFTYFKILPLINECRMLCKSNFFSMNKVGCDRFSSNIATNYSTSLRKISNYWGNV